MGQLAYAVGDPCTACAADVPLCSSGLCGKCCDVLQQQQQQQHAHGCYCS